LIESSKDKLGSPEYCSTYRYSYQQIEEIFASDNGQEVDHTFEDSICRPLIGKQIYKPFFYYCKEDPNVVNVNLESIEHHIKFKDPESHKSKLLEMIQREHMDKDENTMVKI